jgi:Common central domain of tyrosinase
MFKLSSILTIILISLFSFSFMQRTQAQPTNLNCNVEIIGGSSKMYPGELASLTANVTGGQPQNYSWTVEGPIVKDYDDNVYNSTYLTASLNLDPPTYMSPSDFQKSDISFYWQPNKTDTTRTVSVQVQTSNGSCQDSKDYTVAKNNNDINLQAEDFYVEKNHPVGLTSDNRTMTRVLQQHQQWHRDFPALSAEYANNGDLFFDFHRSYIAHFDAWRNLFGYSPIVAWDPGTSLPTGVELNHTNRDVNDTNPYVPFALPTWFRNQPGADGPENRTILFIRNFTDQNQLPSGHPLAGSGLQIEFDGPFDPNDPDFGRLAFLNGHTWPMCEEMDYPKNPLYPRVQDALQDFPPDQKLLGCALTDPYHDDRHSSIGGDMRYTSASPRDPIFWRFHKFIDNVSIQRFFPPSPMASALSAVTDTVPPRIISQNPFRLYPYITTLPIISEKEKGLFGMSGIPALSAQFSEPVIGIKPNDFKVNGSPATQVSGTGVGPYVFIGFKTPRIGPINVTLASGNITDIAGNHFEGTSWKYYLVRPNIDKDKDGLEDTLEVNLLRTNPTVADSDGDGIPDGIEATTKCLNPLVNDAVVMDMSMRLINKTGLDTDRDNKTNVQEFHSKTDPCSPTSQTSLNTTSSNRTGSTSAPLSQSFLSRASTATKMNITGNMTTLPFALVIKRTGGLAGPTSQLQYDSFSKEAISIVNGSKSSRIISDSDDIVARRIINDSGFFYSNKVFYPPVPNSRSCFEYTVIATLNGKLQAVYWSDASEDVPNGIKNLPFILAYVLGTARVF